MRKVTPPPPGFLSAVPCTPCLFGATMRPTNRLQRPSLQYKAFSSVLGQVVRWEAHRFVNPEVFPSRNTKIRRQLILLDSELK
jgi:hypothetical protein